MTIGRNAYLAYKQSLYPRREIPSTIVSTMPYCRSFFVSVDSKVWVHIALGFLKLAPK